MNRLTRIEKNISLRRWKVFQAMKTGLGVCRALVFFVSVSCLVWVGCVPDKPALPVPASVSVELVLPSEVKGAVIEKALYSFYNVSTGESNTSSSGKDVQLLPGLYNVSFEAVCTIPNTSVKVNLKGQREAVQISSQKGGQKVSLEAFVIKEVGDFVIREIFFTGTLYPSGKQYHGDNYVVLHNNTDRVLYADGIALTESTFTSVQKYNYTPDLQMTDFSVEAIYVVPGSGSEHPVPPGGDFVICDTGIDHRAVNPNSFDLSKADMEWYDISSAPAHTDFDSPLVPNMDKWYCYTKSIWVLHNRGFRSYAIARIPVSKQEYLKEYRYTFRYTISAPTGDYPMERQTYRLPNEWILDGVNCSVASKVVWNILPPTIDAGWTNCGTVDKQKDRYFHSVRRKVKEILSDGRVVLQDTNNSTKDFNPMVIPSIVERQKTATDAGGTKASQQTHDGVMPIE